MMTATRTVLLAEDHALLRAGLKSLIDAEPGLRVCGEARDGSEAVHACGRLQPDLVLIDLSMAGRDGIPAIREIHRRWPQLRILVLGAQRGPEVVRDALMAGAHGYVVKDVTADELLMGIRSVLSGEPYISTDVAGAVIDGFLHRRGPAGAASGAAILTAREREVLGLVAGGLTSRRIAARLGVSIKTVDTHRMNLMRKLDLHKASEVTAFAIAHGLLQAPLAADEAGAGSEAAFKCRVGAPLI